MMPVRLVNEALKCTVDFRPEDNTVLITSPGKSRAAVAMGNGSLRMVVDGQEILSDVPPSMINDRTYLPVRFAAQALGASVAWDEVNQQVVITSPAVTAPSNLTSLLAWQEWTVTQAEVRTQQDSPWTAAGGQLNYSDTGSQPYHNDFVITKQDFDISDILVTFEATGSFRTQYGYTGPTIAFGQAHMIYNGTDVNQVLGVVGGYSWEADKRDRTFSLCGMRASKQFADRLIDYSDTTYRSYSLRIKDSQITLTTPDGSYTADAPQATPGTRLPLIVARRQYDQGGTYRLSLRNLQVVEKPQ